jgi:hypothetical protein
LGRGQCCHKQKTNRNALTSPYLWVMSSFAVIPATIFWRNSGVFQLFALLFTATYLLIYRRIYQARFPKWLSIQKKKER